MELLLRELLTKLLLIQGDHPDFESEAVEEALSEVIYHGFLRLESDYQLPDNFGLETSEANRQLQEVLGHFLRHANDYAQSHGMTFHQRLAAFQNPEVTVGPQRHGYNDFFRYFPPSRFDSVGNPVVSG